MAEAGPGQPTKYKPEYCKMLVKHLSEGYSFESFVAELPQDDDVCVRTLYRWVDANPEFCQAKKKGEALGLKFWEKVGARQAVAGKGNATSWIFMMKNRYGWRDKIEVTPPNPAQQKLEQMSDAELREQARLLLESEESK